jgi:amino acid adenylation domain-containing protein
MSKLTSFPHSHGGHFAVSSPRWDSIEFVCSIPNGHNAQSIKKCIDLAYASVIYQYTGDVTIRFLYLDLSKDEETWEIKHIEYNAAEDQYANGVQCKIETFALQQNGHEAPNILINAHNDALLVDEAIFEGGVALHLVYSISDSASAKFRLRYNAHVVDQFHAQRIKTTLQGNIDMFTTHQSRISHVDLKKVREEDIAWMKQWNSSVQTLDYRTIHDCISETAARDPSHAAIEAHDGHLTRGKLAELSQAIALRLSLANVAAGDVVAILMDKSQWVVVTILAVLRIGAAFLLLDPNLPLPRMKVMTEKVRASHTITNAEHSSTSAMLTARTLVHMGHGEFFELDRPAELSADGNRTLPRVSPEDIAFYIFTSGSSGIPKAIGTQHFAWCTGYLRHVHKFGIREGTRVFQYASYSFVVSILDMMSTLLVGGIVCIPGAYERANDLEGAIRRFSPEYLCLTPSVAKVLDPSRLSSLKTLVLVGEPIPSTLVQSWLDNGTARVLNGYGQSEACSMNSTAELGRDPLTHRSIGRSTWLRYWIVDPSDHDRLMPIGAVGELVVEGRSIALGYFGETQRTAKAFIERPNWADFFDIPKECRWYKTGDLVQWQADGDLMLFGRNDAQVKFHGMRVQMGEVEHYVAHAFKEEISEAVVEKVIVRQHEGSDKENLVAFVIERVKRDSTGQVGDQSQDPRRRQEAAKFLRRQMQSRLAQQLPQWMIPSEVMIVDAMPRTATGKLHRNILRELYAAQTPTAVASPTEAQETSSSTQSSAMTDPKLNIMISIWSKIGRVDRSQLAIQSRWTDIGGDSLTAIPLVRESRLAGFSLTTAQIMSGLTLLDASKKTAQRDQTLQHDAVHAQNRGDHESELHSLTDFQKAYLPKSGQKSWVYDYEVSLRGNFDLARLRSAIENLIKRTEVLRTRIVPDPAGILKQTILSATDASLTTRILRKSFPFQQDVLMEPVVFRIADQMEGASGDVTFSVHIHHVIFDGISLHLLMNDLISAYIHGDVLSARPDFTRYLRSNMLRRSPGSYEYWRTLLAGSKPSPYIQHAVGSPDQISKKIELISNEYQLGQILNLGQARTAALHPASVIAQTAWALTLSCITRDTDVMYLYLLHGRDENVPATERIIGCCVTEVPLRMQLDASMASKLLLDRVQQQVHSSIPHSHLGSRTIAESCTNWPQRQGWYHHRSYFLHQNVPETASVPVGDLGYLHVESHTVSRFMLIDFDITTVSAGPKELHFDLRVRKDLYSLEDGKAIEAAFARAVHMVVDGTWTVGQIRDELLTEHRIPTLWEDDDR